MGKYRIDIDTGVYGIDENREAIKEGFLGFDPSIEPPAPIWVYPLVFGCKIFPVEYTEGDSLATVLLSSEPKYHEGFFVRSVHGTMAYYNLVIILEGQLFYSSEREYYFLKKTERDCPHHSFELFKRAYSALGHYCILCGKKAEYADKDYRKSLYCMSNSELREQRMIISSFKESAEIMDKDKYSLYAIELGDTIELIDGILKPKQF